MADLRPTIAPKSDQLNADDLLGTTLTIKITKVALCPEPDQPVAVYFEGDGGKPYKPGKSMRRVMINAWGDESANYIGRRMTLFRDEKVQFGGHAVGGIRISHMSHIGDRDLTMALTSSRANRKPYTVQPLVGGDDAPVKATLADRVVSFKEAVKEAPTVADKRALRKRAAQLFKDIDKDDSPDFVTTSKALDKWFEDQVRDEPSPKAAKTVDETLDGDDIPTEREERPTETVSAPTVEAGQGSVASATPAPTDSQEPAASDTTEPEADQITVGYPAPGEVYFLNGDEWLFDATDDAERRDTYKNGVPVGTAGRGAHAIYEDHAPEVAQDPEPAPTDAPAALPPELQTYVDALEAAESWKAIKTAMGTFYKSATFEALDEDGKNKIRRQTWPYVVDLQDLTPPEVIDQASDVSAFRLWIEYTSDPDAIDGTLPILAKGEEFAKLPDASQNGIRLAAKRRVDMLRVG